MKYLSSVLIVLGFTLLGELLHAVLPLPIPAAIYGLVLLFAALSLKLIRVEQVRPVSDFLIGIMTVLFVSPIVNLLDCWQAAAAHLVPIIIILFVSTVVVFASAGLTTQALLRKEGKGND